MGIKDADFYNSVWSSIIRPQIERIGAEKGIEYIGDGKAKDLVKNAYDILNDHVSENYMQNPDGELNRRKVAACFMYAIVSARPFDVERQKLLEGVNATSPHLPCFANERLAISCGCSILLSFLERAVRDYAKRHGLDDRELSAILGRLDFGVDLLEDVDGGDFLLNLERALSLTSIEGNYNVAILGCMLAYWESGLLDRETYKSVLGEIRWRKGLRELPE